MTDPIRRIERVQIASIQRLERVHERDADHDQSGRRDPHHHPRPGEPHTDSAETETFEHQIGDQSEQAGTYHPRAPQGLPARKTVGSHQPERSDEPHSQRTSYPQEVDAQESGGLDLTA